MLYELAEIDLRDVVAEMMRKNIDEQKQFVNKKFYSCQKTNGHLKSGLQTV
jgi:hypothetical protein